MVLWSCLKKNRSTRKKQRNPINPATFHHWHINSAGTVPASPWPCPSRGRACETARKPSAKSFNGDPALSQFGPRARDFLNPPTWDMVMYMRKKTRSYKNGWCKRDYMAFNMAYQFEKWLYVPVYELQTTYKKLQLRMVGEFSNSKSSTSSGVR